MRAASKSETQIELPVLSQQNSKTPIIPEVENDSPSPKAGSSPLVKKTISFADENMVFKRRDEEAPGRSRKDTQSANKDLNVFGFSSSHYELKQVAD